MGRYNIAQAKALFSELVQRALAGEEVVIARDNKPMLRLAPLNAALTERRRSGPANGLIKVIAPDVDAPLDRFAPYR
jgi:antitoxin (DNA-binding transcriptional repressor) of toxin-antitoxin stability system